MKHTCRLYGLNVSSELPLYQHRSVTPGADIDIEVTLGSPIGKTDDSPRGRTVLDLRTAKQHYTVSKIEGAYLARFYGSCDVRFDPQLTRMTVLPVENVDHGMLSVLVAGTALALLLSLRGAPVLHASAVQVDQGAVAFIGGSGMGKSTMATLFCAKGGLLITDDLLRLALGDGPLTCALGATEVRLRKSGAELVDLFEVAPGRRSTGDARDALATVSAVEEDLPLRAIVVPLPDKSADAGSTAVKQLSPSDALLLLSRFPRLLGWQDSEAMRRQFDQLGEIVTRVPVYIAELPWGPPFPDDLVSCVLDRLDLTIGRFSRSPGSLPA